MSRPARPRRLRIRIQKQMALGELYEVECTSFDEATEAAAFLDERLWSLNQRVLRLNAETGKLPPEQMQTVGNILAGLAGIQLPPRPPTPDETRAQREPA